MGKRNVGKVCHADFEISWKTSVWCESLSGYYTLLQQLNSPRHNPTILPASSQSVSASFPQSVTQFTNVEFGI